jgi:hypothetical protein
MGPITQYTMNTTVRRYILAQKELLAVLAKKIPSAEYCQEFEKYI